MKVRTVIRLVERDGRVLRGFSGSQRQYTHPAKPGKVTMPGRLDAGLHPKTLASILRQAGIEP